ncbi:hypothetical protein ACCAA_680039 [Candidatus Accumulibacter aalborgensis]|uniref:Uncharacterized protein n=1 Tax=Candidatus Accumulibacter aalborgensis TaxID=1860102 RepID=A0A1A8XZ27_9PROT|nr:hypothetical protein ACCAA_680039 [Candidatus Accumulibacter aalborgensis]
MVANARVANPEPKTRSWLGAKLPACLLRPLDDRRNFFAAIGGRHETAPLDYQDPPDHPVGGGHARAHGARLGLAQ